MYRYLLIMALLLLSTTAVFAQDSVVCTMEAKQCPDGSYVSRTGPHCEFTACPGGEGEATSGTVGTGIAAPPVMINPDDMGLSGYPDKPLEIVPTDPPTVRFIIAHRTALNGKRITVHGIIVSTLLGEQACPSAKAFPPMGRPCAQPRITVADAADEDKSKTAEVVILLPENDKTPYTQGQIVDIPVTVSGTKADVMLRKD